MRSCSPVRIPRLHIGTVVPYPWEPAAPPGYLVGMLDVMFLTREILQHRCDSLYACLNCCSLSVRSWSPILIWFAEPVRSCSPVLIPRKYVRSPVPNLWDPAAPTWHVLQPRPDTSYACWNCCSKPVRSCSPVLIPRRHAIWCSEPVRSCSPTWYRLRMFDVVFRTREILQRRPDTLKAC